MAERKRHKWGITSEQAAHDAQQKVAMARYRLIEKIAAAYAGTVASIQGQESDWVHQTYRQRSACFAVAEAYLAKPAELTAARAQDVWAKAMIEACRCAKFKWGVPPDASLTLDQMPPSARLGELAGLRAMREAKQRS